MARQKENQFTLGTEICENIKNLCINKTINTDNYVIACSIETNSYILFTGTLPLPFLNVFSIQGHGPWTFLFLTSPYYKCRFPTGFD